MILQTPLALHADSKCLREKKRGEERKKGEEERKQRGDVCVRMLHVF